MKYIQNFKQANNTDNNDDYNVNDQEQICQLYK